MRTQNLGSSLLKLSHSNFNLRSPDCYLVRSYLIVTVTLPLNDSKVEFARNEDSKNITGLIMRLPAAARSLKNGNY